MSFFDSLVATRERFLSAVNTLPLGYLNGNVEALLAITEELKRSYNVELRIIRAIKRLDVSDLEAVARLTADFQDYHAARGFDKERTHCRNIDRIARTLLVPLQARLTQADHDRVAQLESFLKGLSHHDSMFVDEIEPVMDRALAALELINMYLQTSRTDPTQLAAARQEQQAFIAKFDPEFARLKDVLKRMNELTNNLIDRL